MLVLLLKPIAKGKGNILKVKTSGINPAYELERYIYTGSTVSVYPSVLLSVNASVRRDISFPKPFDLGM